MSRLRVKGRIKKGLPSKLLEWRTKQKKGGIMKPETFAKIEASAAKSKKVTNPAAVAGAAYWATAKAKFKEAIKRRKAKA